MNCYKFLLPLLLLSQYSYSQIQANFRTNDSIVCEGDCIVFTSTSTGEDIETYTWTFSGGVPSSHVGQFPPAVCYDFPGDYLASLDITGQGSTSVSSYSETIHVGLYPDSVFAFKDTTIELGGTAFLYASGYPNGGTFNWLPNDIYDCPTCFSVFASPLLTQYAVVEYYSPDGCAIKDSVLITVAFEDVIDVPNSFSPNGDGVNEVLYVKGPGITSMVFSVFDRYGTLMFASTEQNEGWDGTDEGELLNPATFLWTLEYTLIDGVSNTKTGTISLIK